MGRDKDSVASGIWSVLLVRQPSGPLLWAVTAAATTISMSALMCTAVRIWWLQIPIAVFAIGLPWFYAHDRVTAPLLRALADDAHIRRRYLVLGAVLFVLGCALQFIGTFF